MTAWSKGLNNGQTCIAVDYVMIHASKIDEFITSYRAALQKMYSEGAEKSDSYARIVNNRHFNRLKGYLDDAIAKASVVVGGKTLAEQNYVEPTLLTNVSDGMKIMQDEIFGPLLPVLTYQNKEEVIAYVNGKEKPLALYIHSTDSKTLIIS